MKNIFLSILTLFIFSCDNRIESKVNFDDHSQEPITYQLVYSQILKPNCESCHNQTVTYGNWVLPDTKDGLINVNSQKPGFENEIFVIPGDAENSYLMKRLQGRDGIKVMPQNKQMDQDLINQVGKWIHLEGVSR